MGNGGRSRTLAAAGTIALPFTAVGRTYFRFEPLPATMLWFVVGILLAYFGAAELAKRWFFRRPGESAPGRPEPKVTTSRPGERA